MAFTLKPATDGLVNGYFSLLEHDRLIHAVSTRSGGVSLPPYDSSNLALHVGDDPAAVLENRRLFCRSLGLKAHFVTTARQVHGVKVAVIDEADRGRGMAYYEDALPDTDALITNRSETALLLCFADCVPVLLFDPRNLAVGVCHAGWKGTYGRIVQVALDAMRQRYQTDPDDCIAAIGPSIGPCCFAVDDALRDQFGREFSSYPMDELAVRHNGKWHLDLWRFNVRQLLESGVKQCNIDLAAVCTACEERRFFSYRAAGGATGRIGAVMCLKK